MSDDPLIGATLGGCRIERLLGRGGMGAVYLATQLDLERRVAVKVLPHDLASNQAFLARFEREARTIAQLTHANIVQVYFTGREGPHRFLVMELVEGLSLGGILRARRRLPVEEAADAVLQAARALSAAWARGIIHRDVKPENLLVTTDGVVKVADFGLAKNTEDATRNTQTGALLGTAHYMSPEQAKGMPADVRADVYALGITFWECLAGRRPYEGHTPIAVLYKHMFEPLPNLRALAEVPEEIAALVEKMAHKVPEDRVQAPAKVVEALETWLMRTGTRQRLRVPAGDVPTVEIGTPIPTPARREAETPTQRRHTPTTDAEALVIAQAEAEWHDARPKALALEAEGRAKEGADTIDAFLARPHQGGLRKIEAAALAQSLRADDFGAVDGHLDTLAFADVTADSLWQMGRRAYRDGEFAEAFDAWCEIAPDDEKREALQACQKAAFVGLARALERRAEGAPSKRDAWRELLAACERASRVLSGWPRLTALREWALYADVPDAARATFEEAERLAAGGHSGAIALYRRAHADLLSNPAWEPRARAAIAGFVRRIVDAAVRDVAALTSARAWEQDPGLAWRAWQAAQRGLEHEPANAVLVRTRKKVEGSPAYAQVRAWQEALAGARALQDETERLAYLASLAAKHIGTAFESDVSRELERADAAAWEKVERATAPADWLKAFAAYRAAWPGSSRLAPAAAKELEMRHRDALARAETALASNDATTARAAVEQALALRPGDPAAEQLRARVDALRSKFDEAVIAAETRAKTRAWKAAIDAASQALQIRPGDGRATTVLLQAREALARDPAQFEPARSLSHGAPVTGVAFSPDGAVLASAGADGVLKLWDASSGAQIASIAAHAGAIAALAFHPKRGAVATAATTIKLWDAARGALERELFAARVLSLAFSPDGATLASASEDKTIRLWNLSTGRESGTLPWPLMGATALAFSPDGRYLATAGINASVCTVATRQAASLPKQVGNFVKAAAFAPDGRLVVAGRPGLWVLAAGTWEGRQLESSGDRVRAAAVSPLGALAVATEDAVVQLWDLAAPSKLKTLYGHSGAVAAVAWSPDARAVASGGSDRTVRLWAAKLP